ncbi:MAG: arsenosugar biosynthesis radical SAM protein ArsS [Deltaproteobacteria bacterium]|nr:arsenosugar biosynthesis radical SAM protein ArsS [Deltaproteobacteria bacterium]
MEYTKETPVGTGTDNRFLNALRQSGLRLERGPTRILQINLGRRCNQTCRHCHVEAGPARREVMQWPLMERLIGLASHPTITTVDLTGGAPEMNPHYRSLVEGLSGLGREIITRCNLTVLMEPGFEWLPDFYSRHGLRIVASLPCYGPDNVNRQRGEGVFEKSIAALRLLNSRGYGIQGHPGGLPLDLVYNPGGAFLPGSQSSLEADYRERLGTDHGVSFSSLLTITNIPIGRFGASLNRAGGMEEYLRLLEHSFNPETLPALMCRDTLSVGWDGRLYDCDFNQMLELELGGGKPRLDGSDLDLNQLAAVGIRTGTHCLGCTAGAGSSCGGSLA